MQLDVNSTAILNNSTDVLNSSSIQNSSSATSTNSIFEVALIIFLLPVLAVTVNFVIMFYEAYKKEKKK